MDDAAKTNLRTWGVTGAISLAVVGVCMILVRDGDRLVGRAGGVPRDQRAAGRARVTDGRCPVRGRRVRALRGGRDRGGAAQVASGHRRVARVPAEVDRREGRAQGDRLPARAPGRASPTPCCVTSPRTAPASPRPRDRRVRARGDRGAVPLARWRIVAYVGAVAVAFSRIYLGAHNPLDVLAGAAAGLVIAAVLNLLLLPHHAPVLDAALTPAATTA